VKPKTIGFIPQALREIGVRQRDVGNAGVLVGLKKAAL